MAVYRRFLLAPSETFIRSEALALKRHSSLFVGEQRREGLELPRSQVLVGVPGRRRQRAVRRRLPWLDPDRRLVRGCRSRGVKLIHAHFGQDGLTALDLARRLDVPLIVTFWGIDATMSEHAMLAVGGPLADLARRRSELFDEATLILAVSGFIADELRLHGAPDAKLRVHHTGHVLQPAPGSGSREPVVLFVGRHVEKKGLGDLIEAMALVRNHLPDARVVIVGDGPLRREHERRARELGLQASFVGWMTPEQVAQQLRRARVLCVPSKRASNGDAEGLPTVIPEAGAHGVPVVATRHSGIPEVIDADRGGLLADEGDVESIARHLTAVLGDDGLWWHLSRSARENIERNFDPARQVAELERFYDEALGT